MKNLKQVLILITLQYLITLAYSRTTYDEYKECYKNDCQETYNNWYDSQSPQQILQIYDQWEDFKDCKDDNFVCFGDKDSDYGFDNDDHDDGDDNLYAPKIKMAEKCFKKCKKELIVQELYDREQCRISCLVYDGLDKDVRIDLIITVVGFILSIVLVCLIVYYCRRKRIAKVRAQQQKQEDQIHELQKTQQINQQQFQQQQQALAQPTQETYVIQDEQIKQQNNNNNGQYGIISQGQYQNEIPGLVQQQQNENNNNIPISEVNIWDDKYKQNNLVVKQAI